MPTTTTNFFTDCRTIEEVKNRYRDLAKKYHPDLGGDTATMQFINAEYAEAMRCVIPSEENEYRREQARKVGKRLFYFQLEQISYNCYT